MIALLDDGAVVDAMTVPEGAGVGRRLGAAAAHPARPFVGRRSVTPGGPG